MREDFARAAAAYDEAAVLARETGRRMAERLDLVKIAPRCVADIGCATGDGIRELQRRYPQALPLAIDSALPMLAAVRGRSGRLERLRGRAPRTVSADVRALPLAGGSLGLAWSNLMLHWLDDPRPALAELHRTLEVGGLLMFAMLGPDTLKELRAAARKVMRSGIHGDGAGDAPQEASLGGTVRKFLDMHDIGDMLVAAGFADPVMDMEMVTLTYASPRGLLADQRHLGVRDILFGRMGWRDWRKALAAWERVERRLPASFEIVYGHAWKAAPRVAPDGRAIVRLQRR
jgi:malonyl-CoA O-methyltransferase